MSQSNGNSLPISFPPRSHRPDHNKVLFCHLVPIRQSPSSKKQASYSMRLFVISQVFKLSIIIVNDTLTNHKNQIDNEVYI